MRQGIVINLAGEKIGVVHESKNGDQKFHPSDPFKWALSPRCDKEGLRVVWGDLCPGLLDYPATIIA